MGNYYETKIKHGFSNDAARERTLAILDLFRWRYKPPTPHVIRARTPISIYGWGETFTVAFDDPHHVKVSSESIHPFQFVDMGKNQSNVEKFAEVFRRAKLPLEESEYAQEKHRSFLDRFLSAKRSLVTNIMQNGGTIRSP